jgi:hypothetical protein
LNIGVKTLTLCLLLASVCSCFGQEYWEAQKWIPSDAARLPATETLSLLKQICPDHASETGCDVCPQPTAGNGGSPWVLRAVFLGHFLSSSSQDAVAGGFGCEDHADGVGGSFLLTKKVSSWLIVRYVAGMIAWDCRKLMGSDGRDRLVCGKVDGGQGYLSSSLYLLDPGVDLTKTDTPQRQFTTHSFQDNRGAGFFGVADTRGAMTTPVQRGFIERVEFAGLASRRRTRIIVFARVGLANVPEEIVDKNASGTGPPPNIATVLRRYEFVFDGADVRAAPHNPPLNGFTAVPPLTSYRVAK